MSNTDFMVAEKLPSSSHAPYTKITVPLRKHEISGTIAWSPKNSCMDTATEVATEFLKEENVLGTTKEFSHLSPVTVSKQKALLETIKTVRCVYNDYFQNLHKTYKPQGGKDLAESVDPFLRDPP